MPVPLHRVWAAWTKPELLMQWFCPKPWTVSSCELDVRGRHRHPLYVARAMQLDTAARDKHHEMGFHQGWGKALDQLVELMQTVA